MEEDPESVTQSNVDIRPRSDEHPLKVGRSLGAPHPNACLPLTPDIG